MTPNEGYQRRLGDWEKKEREKRETDDEDAGKSPPKPDVAERGEGFPIGCILVAAAMAIGLAYFLWRLKALGIF